VANVTITQLPAAGPILGTESVPIVQNGQTVQTTTAAIAASPSQLQTFITINQEVTLPNSRYLSTGTGLGLTDGGAQSFYRLTLNAASGSLEIASTGIIAKDGAASVVARTITSGSSGVSIADGNGVSGNPTISLTGTVLSLAGLSSTGMLSLSGGSVNARVLYGTADEIAVANGDGTADPTFRIANNAVFPGTGAVTVPVGTTGQRPAGTNGQIRYNTDNSKFEVYENGLWVDVTTGGVTLINTGAGLTGGPITTTGTIAIATTGVVAATYGSASTVPTIVVNDRGQITSASNTTIAIANTQVSGLGTMAVQDANSVAITGGAIDDVTIGGNTSGTFTTIAAGSVTVSGALTVSGLITPRVTALADSSSITFNASTTDIATQANTQAVGTLTINAPTGAAVNGQKLIFRLRSTNIQTFSWNAAFQGSTDLGLPTASSGGTLYDYMGFIYNSTASKWQLIAKVFGF
jgi:hypothetical protein